MRKFATLFAVTVGLAGCGVSAEKPPSLTVPDALTGCWTLNDPEKDAIHKELLTIEAEQMTVDASWMGRGRVLLTIERIDRASANSFEGLVSFPENGNTATYATEMGIGIRGAPADRLVVVEGDAGSRWFSRCKFGKPE